MIDKWLHIEELDGDSWILPIWSSINDAVQKGRIESLPSEIYELGVYISTRLNILPRVVKRINAEITELFGVAEGHEESNVFTRTKKGCALHINNDLKYNIICDLDSLLFEINSVCELIKKLFETLYSHASKPIKKNKLGLEIKSIFENADHNPNWYRDLVEYRNFFIHEATPYIAIDITNGPGNYDLLIMRENLTLFEDPKNFITLSELNVIVQGFIDAMPIIQNDLVSLFKAT